MNHQGYNKSREKNLYEAESVLGIVVGDHTSES